LFGVAALTDRARRHGMAYDHLFTVFTPTYNRAHLLPRVHESLKAQTFRDFEWLIVDDGSSDGTRDLVASWQAAAPFPIRYHWQANAGKHVATNRAAHMARGKLLLTLDSDDECLPHALERFAKHWADIEALPPHVAATYSGVTVLCQDQHGAPVGTRFPIDVLDSDSSELKYRFHVRGDKWGFHRTDVFREFPFPVLPGCAFVPESVVWSAIGRKYKTRFVNEVLLVVWIHDGPRLTSSGVRAASAAGMALWHGGILDTELRFFHHAPLALAKSAIHYARFSLHAGVGLRKQPGGLTSPAARLLWACAAPLGVATYLMDQRATRGQPANAAA
jgi:hypothetical protein